MREDFIKYEKLMMNTGFIGVLMHLIFNVRLMTYTFTSSEDRPMACHQYVK